MKIETLLPLGKLDPGLREPDTPLHISDFAAGAQLAELRITLHLVSAEAVIGAVHARSRLSGGRSYAAPLRGGLAPADSVRLHPICTERFIDEAVTPALAVGARRGNRDVAEVEVCMKPLIGTAPDERSLEKVTKTVRAQGWLLSLNAVIPSGV